MHVGRQYSVREVLTWTRTAIVFFTLLSGLPTIAWVVYGQRWMALPWQPVALVGTAVAFVTGFQNNAAYGRLWEARQIWGSIINLSRTWAVQVLDLPTSAAEVKKRLVDRHLGWLTALRYQLREKRAWETVDRHDNKAYQHFYDVPEWKTELAVELEKYVAEPERAKVLALKNRATHLLAAQSHELAAIAAKGELTDLRFLELERTIAGLYDCQGRCERIKNFPYPRQFATLNGYFKTALLAALPFALLPEFQKLGDGYVWVTIPTAVVVSWVFHMLEKIGEATENPFMGGPNDVPISTMARTIEIDLRELLGETPPPPLAPMNNISN
ncbi:MAG: bestrophin family ion channel [Myxococcaceae bacterium]